MQTFVAATALMAVILPIHGSTFLITFRALIFLLDRWSSGGLRYTLQSQLSIMLCDPDLTDNS
jgi:hypothetical protein